MEDIVEFILELLLIPFDDKIDNLMIKINRIPSKVLKILIKVLLILSATALLFGIMSLCSYIFRGYWV